MRRALQTVARRISNTANGTERPRLATPLVAERVTLTFHMLSWDRSAVALHWSLEPLRAYATRPLRKAEVDFGIIWGQNTVPRATNPSCVLQRKTFDFRVLNIFNEFGE